MQAELAALQEQKAHVDTLLSNKLDCDLRGGSIKLPIASASVGAALRSILMWPKAAERITQETVANGLYALGTVAETQCLRMFDCEGPVKMGHGVIDLDGAVLVMESKLDGSSFTNLMVAGTPLSPRGTMSALLLIQNSCSMNNCPIVCKHCVTLLSDHLTSCCCVQGHALCATARTATSPSEMPCSQGVP